MEALFVELPASPRTTERVHRDTRRAQGLHVAVHGAARNLEALGHFPTGHAASRLKEEKSGEKSISFHGITGTKCGALIMTRDVIYARLGSGSRIEPWLQAIHFEEFTCRC